jgi:hypothetical protein
MAERKFRYNALGSKTPSNLLSKWSGPRAASATLAETMGNISSFKASAKEKALADALKNRRADLKRNAVWQRSEEKRWDAQNRQNAAWQRAEETKYQAGIKHKEALRVRGLQTLLQNPSTPEEDKPALMRELSDLTGIQYQPSQGNEFAGLANQPQENPQTPSGPQASSGGGGFLSAVKNYMTGNPFQTNPKTHVNATGWDHDTGGMGNSDLMNQIIQAQKIGKPLPAQHYQGLSTQQLFQVWQQTGDPIARQMGKMKDLQENG